MNRARNLIRACAAITLMLLFAGCALTRGAAPSPFDESLYRGKSAPLGMDSQHIEDLLDADGEADRNAAMRRILLLTDLLYLEFSADFLANRKHFGAATNGLGLLADVAGTLTDSVGVKTNYSALGALLTGSTGIVDSTYLFDHAILAMIETMDEQRANVLIEIRESMILPIDEYSGHTALGDAIRYYRAGTLSNAALELQRAAAARADERQAKARTVPIPTDAQVSEAVALGEAFFVFVRDAANADAVRKALIAIQAPGIDAKSDATAVRAKAISIFRDLGPVDGARTLVAALEKEGFVH